MEKFTSSTSTGNGRSAILQSRGMALVPAGVMGIFAILMWGRPVARPIISQNAVAQTTITAEEPVVPVSTTLVVGNAATEQLRLQGRLAAFEATQILAPTSGLMARLLVKQGQMVQAGETIAMISNQAVPAAEQTKIAAQQQAEAAQEEAARQQSILQAKLEQEEDLLKSANLRVEKAATRLAHARDLVRRLQNGEKVKRSEVAELSGTASSSAHSASTTKAATTVSKEDNTAAVEAARARAAETAREASAKWQQLHVLLSRQAAAQQAEKADQENTSIPASEVPSAETIQNARNAAEQAQKAADAARAKAYELQYGNINRAKSSNAATTKPAASTHSGADDQFVTATDASRIAQSALQESKDALAQVDSIQRQIDRYQQPVEHTTNRIESANVHLENAQRALFDNPARVQMTPVVATAGGVVQSLMTLASEVTQGDKIADIVPANLLLLELRDNSGFWKKLKADDRFMVTVRADETSQEMPSVARLIGVVPPTKEGGAAVLRLQVFNPVQQSATTPSPQKPSATVPSTETAQMARPRWFKAGMAAVCLFPTEEKAISIPRSALHLGPTGKYQVAVLQPLASFPETAAAPDNSETYQVEWRDVEVDINASPANATGAQVAVISGLLNGERISLRPQAIYQLIRAKGNRATVQINET